jgi:hypothetical protein
MGDFPVSPPGLNQPKPPRKPYLVQ